MPLGAPDDVRGGQGSGPACPLSGLVVIAAAKLPIPSRTRPISATTPMVLRLKTWESRSPPNLTSDRNLSNTISNQKGPQTTRGPTGSQTQGNSRRGVEQHPATRRRRKPSRRDKPKSPGCPADQWSKSVAGWSSPVARQAHNLKVTGSNPVPATKLLRLIKDFKAEHNARLLSFQILVNTWSTFYEAPHRRCG